MTTLPADWPAMDAVLTDIGYAKINLALHIRARRPDGYHALETVFAFAEDGDVLTATPATALTLSITGPFAQGLSAGEDNLVLRAVRALGRAHDRSSGIAFTLDKRLPIASGIGGGSADAAAALRLAARLWALDEPTAQTLRIASQIGADVPACLGSRTCFGTGVGDSLSDFDDASVSGLPILLVNPNLACPTGPVFKAWDGVDRGALDRARWRQARNDLEAPALQLLPGIGDVLASLKALPGVSLTRMSGSGATCFAVFETIADRDAAASALARIRPDWWMLATRLR